MEELCYLAAGELAGRIRRRELSATELLDAQLARIEKLNPALGAVVSLEADRARESAVAADQALAGDAPVGPLHGVPMVLKDGHDVAGLRTTIGTEIFDRISEQDGTVAARLRAAGAIIAGHSNVPPFLADYRTENALFGRTSNPWDPSRTPGGSSGGAAAALAAGLTPIEVGSDLAGSVRLPSHCCGVYGLKVTEHRVPATGYFRPLPGVPRSVRVLGSLGPMARTLDDLELVLRVIAGPDGQDADVPPVPLGARSPRRLSALRLAVASALPGTTVADSLRAEVERVAVQAARAGARVVDRLPEVDWSEQALFVELLTAVTGIFDPSAELSDEQRSLAWYLAALDRRDRFAAAWEAFFSEHDVLVLPPAATVAFGHDDTDYTAHGGLLVFANLAGLPALTVPAGLDESGLPIGLQLVGPRWSEMRLLEVAAALEAAGILPGFIRPPGY
jgi:amidase